MVLHTYILTSNHFILFVQSEQLSSMETKHEHKQEMLQAIQGDLEVSLANLMLYASVHNLITERAA